MFEHKTLQFSRRVLSENDLEETTSDISFLVTDKLLLGNSGTLEVRCTASIYSLGHKSSKITFLSNKPQKAIFSPETRANPYLIDTEISAHDVKRSQSEKSNENYVIEGKCGVTLFAYVTYWWWC